MPILLPSLRIVIRIVKGKTSFSKQNILDKDFLISTKGILNYKMRIVRQEFLRLLKEIVKRDSSYGLILLNLSYIETIFTKIRSEDSMVISKTFIIKIK